MCVASACFNHDVFAMYISEFDWDFKDPSLGAKERFCVSAMSVMILGAEICW